VTLIGAEPGHIEWDRVASIGIERGLTLQLAAALRYHCRRWARRQ